MSVSFRSSGLGFLVGTGVTLAAVFLMRPGRPPDNARPVGGEGVAAPSKWAEPDVKADLADAIRALESSDYRSYLEMYEPLEWLRSRRNHNMVDRTIESMAKSHPAPRLLAALREMAKHDPAYDAARALATFEIDLPDDMPVPEKDWQEVFDRYRGRPGFGTELSRVIEEAEKTLAAEKYEDFVNAMLPPLVAGPFDGSRTRALVEAMRDDPAMVRRMADDLAALKNLKAEMSDDGKTASFRLGTKPAGAPGATAAEVERLVKFSLVDDNWRFFDDTSRTNGHLVDFMQRRARDARVTIRMERIGGNWRFLPFEL